MSIKCCVDVLRHLLPRTKNLQLESWHIDETQATITLIVTATRTVVNCPVCNCATHRIHSHYQRRLTDKPWADENIVLQLRVRKFFCTNKVCPRQIFTERLPEVTVPWGRRTQRLTEQLVAVGLGLGGAPGERLSRQLGFQISRNTLLRLISILPIPSLVNPQTLGVDDFAFRKRQSYGTIIVDLDQRRPVAILGNRDAGTLAEWLKNYPSIQVLSRDRSKAYKNGMTTGAPQAIQVADRFHLLQNLSEVLTQVFGSYGKILTTVEALHRLQTVSDSSPTQVVAVTLPGSTAQVQEQSEQRRIRRLAIYQQVWDLHSCGWSAPKIAHQVGISTRTVQRYLQRPKFPERHSRSDRGKSLLNPYKEYLVKRWNEHCYEAKKLFREIQQLGYCGSYKTVTRYVHQLCQAQGWKLQQRPTNRRLPPVTEPKQPPLTARRAASLVLRRSEKHDSDSQQLIAQLMAHPELSGAIDLAQNFAQLVRQRQPEQFDQWLSLAIQIQKAEVRGQRAEGTHT